MSDLITKEVPDIIHILPFQEEDVYHLNPMFGMILDLSNYKPPIKCLRCGGMLYIPFTRAELGDISMTNGNGNILYPYARRSDIIVRSEPQPPSILVKNRKVTRVQAYGSSISHTNEKDEFEIIVNDIKFEDAPKHICPFACQTCNKDVSNLNDIDVRMAEFNFCSVACADKWINENKEKHLDNCGYTI